MGIMVRPSTQQTVDRIVGAATILGLSIAIARWISLQVPYSSPDNDNYPSPKNKENPTKCDSKYDASFAKRWIMPWWWPVIAMRRWNSSKNKHNRQQNGTDDGDDYFKSQSSHEGEEGAKGGEDDELQCDHRGSCHCGSINFVVSGFEI